MARDDEAWPVFGRMLPDLTIADDPPIEGFHQVASQLGPQFITAPLNVLEGMAAREVNAPPEPPDSREVPCASCRATVEALRAGENLGFLTAIVFKMHAENGCYRGEPDAGMMEISRRYKGMRARGHVTDPPTEDLFEQMRRAAARDARRIKPIPRGACGVPGCKAPEHPGTRVRQPHHQPRQARVLYFPEGADPIAPLCVKHMVWLHDHYVYGQAVPGFDSPPAWYVRALLRYNVTQGGHPGNYPEEPYDE